MPKKHICFMLTIFMVISTVFCACIAQPNYSQETERPDTSPYLGNWEGYFKNTSGSYNLEITGIDFENETITGSFSAEARVMNAAGGLKDISLNAEGEYSFTKRNAGYYELCISESGYCYVFKIDDFRISGLCIYNIRTGCGI